MDRTFINHWVVLKSGELRRREKKPKGKFVLEVVTYQENQVSEHVISNPENNYRIRLIARCGYDRGPKLQACIRRIWEMS